MEESQERCPQGSVLGPVLFLIFINNIESDLSSNVLKFADDTKVYRVVDSHSDGQSLQTDLANVEIWAIQWQMQFNVDKCKVMHYGKDNIGFKYNICGQELESMMLERDLGVHISSDLKVGSQCKEAYCKASQILGLISRTMYVGQRLHDIAPGITEYCITATKKYSHHCRNWANTTAMIHIKINCKST